MKTKCFIVLAGLTIACMSNTNNISDDVSGTYAREYSYNVTNPESGRGIGIRVIRDTIFVRSVDDKFEVSNHKWSKNDYDQEGWRSMQHSDDRPFPTFQAEFAKETQSLGLGTELVIKIDGGRLVGPGSSRPSYLKVK